jgi:type VI secretion system protein ImpM
MPAGLYGKLPAHGDFVRRGLPDGFVAGWDAWLQAAIPTARDLLGESFGQTWDAAPAWCFRLAAGACGPAAMAGVMLPSRDMVGRRFPLTLAEPLPPGAAPPNQGWYAALRQAAWDACRDECDADGLLAALPAASWPGDAAPEPGWWITPDAHWALYDLPPPTQFHILLQGGA